MKKISIIIPVYNSEKYLNRCIDSILNQSFKDYELLLINDGSKDNSLKIIKEYAKKDKRVKVIDKKNEGVAKTRNLGIKEATGKYIMFIDNDDYIENNYLKDYYDSINTSDFDIVIGGYKRKDATGKIISTLKLDSENDWSKYTVITPWAKIYKRDFLLNNDIKYFSYKIGEDIYFNLLAYSKTKKIKIIDNTDYIWFYNNESVSNTVHKGLNKDVDVLNLLKKLVVDIKNKDEYFDYFIEKFIIWYLLYSGRDSSKDEFIKEYKRLYLWKSENNIKTNISPLSSKLKGETFKNRLFIIIFRFISKFKLIGLFATIYCRGDKNE